MRDARLDRLADLMVNYSVKVQPGQLVRVSGPTQGLPLLEAIYEAVLQAGGHPLLRIGSDACSEYFLQNASDEQLDHLNPLLLAEAETIDASIGIWAESNTKALSQIDPARQAQSAKARTPVSEIFMERAAAVDAPEQFPGVKPLRWVGTLFPTQASAQDAEMSLRDYADFVFNAGYLHEANPVAIWEAIRARQQRVADFLKDKKELRFQAANGTDLLVNIEGMTWINCAGESNFPDGEVFTGPNLKAADGGTNGYVKYSFPALHAGREVDGIELWFESGKVVKAKAAKGEAFLKAMIEQDEGASRLGEIAIGTNYQIQQYSKNTLFDEKIGGTFHAALGKGYPETGNSNESAMHWDMVCDLRSPENGGIEQAGGTISADGEVIAKDGEFVFEDWPGSE